MGLFRSEEMHLYKIFLTRDNTWEIMNELGKVDALHFINMNADEQVFNLPFAQQVKRCDDLQFKLEMIQNECKKQGIKLTPPTDVDSFLSQIEHYMQKKQKFASSLFDQIENDVMDNAEFVTSQKVQLKSLHDQYLSSMEFKHLLQNQDAIRVNLVNSSAIDLEENAVSEPLLGGHGKVISSDGLPQQVSLSHIAGLINTEDVMRLKKLVFRSSRGKAYIVFRDFEKELHNYEGKLIKRTAYYILYEDGEYMRGKMLRICESFDSKSIFQLPTNTIRKIQETDEQVMDSVRAMQTTRNNLRSYLKQINEVDSNTLTSTILIYQWFVKKERTLYSTLNCLKPEKQILYGFLWSPLMPNEIFNVISGIRDENKGISGPQIEEISDWGDHNPPTLIRTNDFLAPFQEIVDTYGVPAYQEVNPALFAIVTFPFLFAVMFGDIGHGLMLFLSGAFLCFGGRYAEATGSVYSARYLLVLLGTFAIYTGFVYNDFMAIPLETFGPSCYDTKTLIDGTKDVTLKPDCVYPFGIDPKWYQATNQLAYFNSMKMKIAVILGVAQMAFGVCLKAMNAKHFKRRYDFLYEFLPQFILLLSLFGYMDLLIIIKWLTNYDFEGAEPPSVITIMIDMPLNGGKVKGDALIISDGWNQALNNLLLVVAFICVPTMLFPKPLLEFEEIKKKHQEELEKSGKFKSGYKVLAADEDEALKFNIQQDDDEEEEENKDNKIIATAGREDEKHEDIVNPLEKSDEKQIKQNPNEKEVNLNAILGEMFIHQLIECIEFVLGTVSNTASYLRLWALSLAHSQLASVFYENTVGAGVEANSSFVMFIMFPVFGTATLGVLMSMDSMECFLHTLRLHWVEFQNKFYKGNGYKFAPFSFKRTLMK